MIVISDSGPLRYLVLIEEEHFLPALFGAIVIPSYVAAELTQKNTPSTVRLWMEQSPEWAKIASSYSPLAHISSALDLGEREAIALAEELSADLLLVDDGAARREATRRELPVMGTLGILDLAAEHGHADFSAAARKLMQTNFRASGKLIQFFLERDALRKQRYGKEQTP
jgi:predicted nucleic acid-binding protein